MPHRETGISNEGKDPLVGQVLADKYEIQSVIARGGMGVIYRAEQKPLGRQVAIKVLSVRFAAEEDPGFQDRFFLEAATLAKLKHQNTVTVFDYGTTPDNTYYMVMEFVEGRTLSSILRSRGSLDPVRALRIAYEIARSLSEAHENGIIHRDLKPSNVMVVPSDEGETVKVVDFGIVKVLEDTGIDTITRPDRMVGSPRYMAPEQIRKGDIDGRTDLYALGVVLYEMLTGKPPFKGSTSVKTLMAHVQDPVPPMSAKTKRSIPLTVEQLVARCLQKKPDNRFPDAASFKSAVRSVLVDIGGAPMDTLDTSGEYHAVDPITGEQDATTLNTATPDIPGRLPRAALAAGAAVLLLFVASVAAGWMAFRNVGEGPEEEPEPADVTVQPPNVVTVPTSGPVKSDPVVAYRTSSVWFTSSPENAEVWEGDKLHGTTPLVVPLKLEPDEPPRTFVLRATGHAPYEVTQGPSPRDVDVHALLQPASDAAPEPAAAPDPPPEPQVDIRIER